MKFIKSISLLLFLSFWAVSMNAQKVGAQVNENYEKNWSFGAGFNVVDDSGQVIGGIANPSKYWNFSSPFYLSAEYYLNNEFSFMAMMSINGYKAGKQIDNAIVIEGEEASYFAFDVNAKYSFRDIMRTYKFDPYLMLGFGVQNISDYKTLFEEYGESTIRDIPAASAFTINFGFGFNYWFSQTWGMNMNFAGKWNTGTNFDTNLKQYSIGAVYFLNK